MVSDSSIFCADEDPETDTRSNPQSGSVEGGALINKKGFDNGLLDIDSDFLYEKPTTDESLNAFDETEPGEAAADYDESFTQSEIVKMVNDQIQDDFGEYLQEDAKSMDLNTVEIKPGIEFDNNAQYGYYDWYNSGKLVVNQDAGGTVETLVHEGLHMATDNGDEMRPDGELIHHLGIEEVALDLDSGDIKAVSNMNLNEGITEMFTRQSVKNMGVDDISIAYPDEVEIAEFLSDLVGENVIKDAYFSSDVEGLRTSVDSELGQGAFDTINIFMDYGAPYAAMMIIEDGMPAEGG